MVPEKLMADFMKLSINNLGSIIPVPEGVRVELHSRPMFAGGEYLSWGSDDVMLVVSGALFVTSPVERVGYREIRIDGPMYVPKGSEGPIRAKLRDLRGPSFSYRYPPGARLIISEETFGRAFLEMLPEPTPLLVFGELTFEKDVTPELLKSKIPEIVLIGQISVPKDLLPVVQILTEQKFGRRTFARSWHCIRWAICPARRSGKCSVGRLGRSDISCHRPGRCSMSC